MTRQGQQQRWFSACILGLIVAVPAWHPAGVLAGDALTETNARIVVRKAAPDRPGNTAPQLQLYLGSRVASVTSTVAPQNPYDSDYASLRRAYHKAIVGFRLALTSHVYLFVGVGMAVPDKLLEQGLGQNISTTAAQIQNALGLQTEYGLGWDF